MPNLTQLKLQGICLSQVQVTDDLIMGLENHKAKLELLDLQDCQITAPQMTSITQALLDFTGIHSLDLSYNRINHINEKLMANLCEIINKPSKLNHVSFSYMALGFKACQKIVTAAAQSPSLCALHISGNKMSIVQRKFLLRILSIKESELDTSEDIMNRISSDEVRAALEGKYISKDSPRNQIENSERKRQFRANNAFT